MTEEKKVAIALEYDPQVSPAPRVTATGTGVTAEKIIEKAQESGVPIQSNPELAAILSKLDIGQNIPEELYKIVAEILIFIYGIDSKLSKGK